MKLLTILANKYKSDKGTEQGSCHGFTDVYDDYLSNIKESATSILEIGVNDGSSLSMWYDYFKNAAIYGLDIDDKSQYDNDRVACNILDQSSEEHLKHFADNINLQFDFIIDDGSHHMSDQQLTFGYFFPLLRPGGIYIIEDLHTSLCENGTMVYGRPIEVYPDKTNTTLHYLQDKPYSSRYLTDQQNSYLQKHIKEVFILDKENQYVPADYKHRSITSIITKNKV